MLWLPCRVVAAHALRTRRTAVARSLGAVRAMGIKGLMKLISDEAPDAVKEYTLANYNGRVVAIDASMAIYQFLIAVRSGSDGRAATMLTNEAGEVTSHVQGMFNRTINMMEAGIKPVFVFDGKPPTMKGGELAKRYQKREKANADLAKANESGNVEDMDRFSKRTVRATKQHSQDCKDLLALMGVPIVDAPCEAEAQCAALATAGKAFAAATEDMDALTFRTPKLLKRMTFGAANANVVEVDLEKVLGGLKLSMDEFVDLCILCGCDYCNSIKGIGPKTALSLIRKYHSIEKILPNLNKKSNPLPPDWLDKRRKVKAPPTPEKKAVQEKREDVGVKEGDQGEAGEDVKKMEVVEGEGEGEEEGDKKAETEGDALAKELAEEEAGEEETDLSLIEQPSDESDDKDKEQEEGEGEWEPQVPAYIEARRLFQQAEVADPATIDLNWKNPDEEGLKTFLVDRLGFNVERVTKGIAKLKDARGKTNQKLLYNYFSAKGSSSSTLGAKRKDDLASAAASKKAKGAPKGKGGGAKGGAGKPRK